MEVAPSRRSPTKGEGQLESTSGGDQERADAPPNLGSNVVPHIGAGVARRGDNPLDGEHADVYSVPRGDFGHVRGAGGGEEESCYHPRVISSRTEETLRLEGDI